MTASDDRNTDDTKAIEESNGADEFDRHRRRVLWAMPTGLYVIGSRAGDEVNLMTANLVVQVCMEPKLVAVAVEREAVTMRLVRRVRTASALWRNRATISSGSKPGTAVSVDAASAHGAHPRRRSAPATAVSKAQKNPRVDLDPSRHHDASHYNGPAVEMASAVRPQGAERHVRTGCDKEFS